MYLGVAAGVVVRGRQTTPPACLLEHWFAPRPARPSSQPARCSSPLRRQVLLLLWFVVEDHDTLFILSESVHFVGIGLLAYKLIKKRAAGGELRRRSCCRCPAGTVRRLDGWQRCCRSAASVLAGVATTAPDAACWHCRRCSPAGLSLRTQELTAAFLAVRLFW